MRLVSLATAALLLALPAAAHAACAQKDVRGDWLLVTTNECEITVGADGAFAIAKCYDDTGKVVSRVSGRLEIAENCKITGKVVQRVDGQRIPLEVTARLDSTKEMVVGRAVSGDVRIPFRAYAQ